MKTLLIVTVTLLAFSACSHQPEAVAMNEYNPEVTTKAPAVGVITPELIQEVQQRREAYIRAHSQELKY